ncbi:hypothetical protein M5K25_001656 [Dendrobium thyrsiflorum]|uniref:Uncharacterized protein n=1 Tax=Dendrobium thyrsiflorum TaxID=117978 RepID=A0ABD0VR18_DENTH
MRFRGTATRNKTGETDKQNRLEKKRSIIITRRRWWWWWVVSLEDVELFSEPGPVLDALLLLLVDVLVHLVLKLQLLSFKGVELGLKGFKPVHQLIYLGALAEWLWCRNWRRYLLRLIFLCFFPRLSLFWMEASAVEDVEGIVGEECRTMGFNAIGEHMGAGHNRNIVMLFGGESPGSEGPKLPRLSSDKDEMISTERKRVRVATGVGTAGVVRSLAIWKRRRRLAGGIGEQGGVGFSGFKGWSQKLGQRLMLELGVGTGREGRSAGARQ